MPYAPPALARSYGGVADWILLDSYEAGDRQIGAMGVTHGSLTGASSKACVFRRLSPGD